MFALLKAFVIVTGEKNGSVLVAKVNRRLSVCMTLTPFWTFLCRCCKKQETHFFFVPMTRARIEPSSEKKSFFVIHRNIFVC